MRITQFLGMLSAMFGLSLVATQGVAHAEDQEIRSFANWCQKAEGHQYHAKIEDGQVFVLPVGTTATSFEVRQSAAGKDKGRYFLCFAVTPREVGPRPLVERHVNLLIGDKKLTLVIMEKPKSVRD